MAEYGKAYTRRICSEIGRAGTPPALGRLLMALPCPTGAKMSESMGASCSTAARLNERLNPVERRALARILRKLLEGLRATEPDPAESAPPC